MGIGGHYRISAAAQTARFETVYRQVGYAYKNKRGIRAVVDKLAVRGAGIVYYYIARMEMLNGIVKLDGSVAFFYEHDFAKVVRMKMARFGAPPGRILIAYRKQQFVFVLFVTTSFTV